MRNSILMIVLALALGGCSAGKDMQLADGAVAAFHNELNGGRIDAIYQEAGPEMKAAPGEVTQLLAAVHRKLGRFQSGKATGWNDNLSTNGHFVTVGYASTYDHGKAGEQFVFRLAGDRALLVGYHVNSNALIVN